MKNNKGGVDIGMVIFILTLISPAVAAVIAKQWYYLYTLLAFYVALIIFEIVSVKRTGKTISRSIGELKEKSPWKFWLIEGTLVIMTGGLFIHFLMM